MSVDFNIMADHLKKTMAVKCPHRRSTVEEIDDLVYLDCADCGMHWVANPKQVAAWKVVAP